LAPPSTVCISQRFALRQLGQVRPGLGSGEERMLVKSLARKQKRTHSEV
jgi:hypothetical protein